MTMEPSSSSSCSYTFTYDVFLSFRGEDTRYGFTGHLHRDLDASGIHTFIDDIHLRKGEEITPTLEKAIEESRIFIIVISENYASSSYCLSELAHILKFVKDKSRLVLPVFYNVDPSDVRHHRGSFQTALADHKNKFDYDANWDRNMEKLETWKMALTQVADFSAYTFKHGVEYEHEFTKKIVEFVSSKINRVSLHIDLADYLVRLKSQMSKVNSLLEVGSDKVIHMVGIYGLGGVGKTTLAAAVYNSNIVEPSQFEAFCFLENVGETSNRHGLSHVQNILLCQTVGEKDFKIISVKQGIPIIRHRLERKKVLLIVDGVDTQEQLQVIAGSPNWFGPGSRIIITTRDKQLLKYHGVKRTFKMTAWEGSGKVNQLYKNVWELISAYALKLHPSLEVRGSNQGLQLKLHAKFDGKS